MEQEVRGELIARDRCALVVVDVQNDYCHAEGTFGRAGVELGAIQRAVDRIVQLVDLAREAGVPVVWVRTEHDGWTNSETWLTRDVRGGSEICATGSWGAEFFRVRPRADECVVVKHRYSAFVGTRFAVVLRALGRSTLLFAGITTNVCVESTARDAFMRDYQVVLVEDCAAARTKAEHDGAVHNVRTYFGRVLDRAAVAARWAVAAPA
ncbi:MAG TPA: cysteine hydrolase [Methylomirabilota bacterium]